MLARLNPSPVVELNRAVAVALCDGPTAGLALVDRTLERGGLGDSHLAHAVRADRCPRLGGTAAAALPADERSISHGRSRSGVPGHHR